MDSHSAETRVPGADAIEFVRFCYRRKRVGWPELYDEMCAVAGRALFRGYDADDLTGIGIGLCLGDMPGLAAIAAHVVREEQEARRPVAATIALAAPHDHDDEPARDGGLPALRSLTAVSAAV
jgi:hypothetical protein